MTDARPRDAVNVGFVQMNTAVDSSVYLPYSVALLQAYVQEHAERPDRYSFGIPIIHRLTPSTAAATIGDVDMVGFSMYVWNANRTLAVARELKATRPETLVVFGGPHVPDDAEEFLTCAPVHRRRLPRRGRADVLRDRRAIPGAELGGRGECQLRRRLRRFVAVPRRPRIADLSVVPSPFLEGVFAPLMEAYPGTAWRTVWETNRGCPFKCTFCDWGSAIAAKVHRFQLERIHAEAEWIAANGIDYLFIGDANFGILPRDVEIAEAVVAAAKRHGYPKKVLVQQTKNATDRAYLTMKTIAEGGLATEMNISIQTTTPEVLEAIKRQNISLETYAELQRRFVHDGIPTFVDMIVGLPRRDASSRSRRASRVSSSADSTTGCNSTT